MRSRIRRDLRTPFVPLHKELTKEDKGVNDVISVMIMDFLWYANIVNYIRFLEFFLASRKPLKGKSL